MSQRSTGPACGNNPNHRLTPGDRRAVENFKAYLADRSALRDRIAEAALAAVEAALGDTLVPAAREEALAGIVAVLPEPADRAAIYRQLATSYERIVAAALPGDKPDWYEAIADVARGLRRMADETPAAEASVDLPARLEAALTERYTELGNPFSRMRRQEQGPDGWPAERPVGPHHVAEVLRELLAAGARQDGAAR